MSALRIRAAPLNVRNPDTLVRGCAAGKADRNVRVTHTGCAAQRAGDAGEGRECG
jgi:hypothetical protein